MDGTELRPPAVGALADWKMNITVEKRRGIVQWMIDLGKEIVHPQCVDELKKMVVGCEERIFAKATNQEEYVKKIAKKLDGLKGYKDRKETEGLLSLISFENQSEMDPSSLQDNKQNQRNIVRRHIPSLMQKHPQTIVSQQQEEPSMHQESSSLQQQFTPDRDKLCSLTQPSTLHGLVNKTLHGLVNKSQVQHQNHVYYTEEDNVTPNLNSKTLRQPSRNQQHFQKPSEHQLIQQKMQHPSKLQSHMHQQQTQSLWQANQLRSSQQRLMEMTSVFQSGPSTMQTTQPGMVLSAQQANLQLNQQNVVKQSMPSSMQQHRQSVPREQQGRSTMHQESSSFQQQSTPNHDQFDRSMDSGVQSGLASHVDWQEEVYQKIKSMKESYLAELRQHHQIVVSKVNQFETLEVYVKHSEVLEKTKGIMHRLENIIVLLQTDKNDVQLEWKDKLPDCERQIVGFLAANRNDRITPSELHAQEQFQHGAHSMPLKPQPQVQLLQQQYSHLSQPQVQNESSKALSSSVADDFSVRNKRKHHMSVMAGNDETSDFHPTEAFRYKRQKGEETNRWTSIQS